MAPCSSFQTVLFLAGNKDGQLPVFLRPVCCPQIVKVTECKGNAHLRGFNELFIGSV